MLPKTRNLSLIPTGARKRAGALVLLSLTAAAAATTSPIWTQQQQLTASNGAAGDYFGGCVSVSGNTAVIGAPGKNGFQGAAYVFVESGGVWSLQQELTASDGAANDQFGLIPSVSGDTAVIGAVGKNSGQGAAYVFVRSGGVWTQQAEFTASDGAAGDNFGYFVSVSGSTALIGAPGKNAKQGAAYVFAGSGGRWSQLQELTAPDGAANDQFAVSAAVSGNTLLIGAPFATVASSSIGYVQGAGYVFVESGGVWSLQQELTASDAASGDFLGYSVSVSGDTALLGAMNKNSAQGAAYVFMRSGTAWSQQQELTASDGAASDQFGYFVSLSGGMALIGALGKTVNSNAHQGAAYVFAQSGGSWSQQQELTASDGEAGDGFGGFASVSGNTAVIGVNTRNHDQGAAYVFTSPQPAMVGLSVSGGGFNIAPNSWIEIYGASLAPPSVGADGLVWSSAPSFASGQMPTQLQDVSVTVNGKPAYVSFISATQVNVLTPLDSTTGAVAVTVINGATISPTLIANLQPVSPGFLRFSDGIHIAARHGDYSLLGPASLSAPGSTFTPAKPGEIIQLYGAGFGLPVSPLTAGSDVQSAPLPTPWPQVTIGGIAATVQYAGLASPGLYQINVVVPPNAANGDNQVIATYAGVSSPAGALIPVSQYGPTALKQAARDRSAKLRPIREIQENEASDTMWTAFMPRIARFCAGLSMVAIGLWGQVSAPPLLVHLYPVVLDSKGQPVTDLTAGDFKIADQGKSQTIFLFRRPAVSGSAALGLHEYTNRPGGVWPHSIAILFDLLNSSDANRVDTWHSLVKSIPLLESAEQVYFYVLNLDGELEPIHPIGIQGSGDGRSWLSTFEKDLDLVMRNANLVRPAGIDQEDRTKRTYHQIEVVSNQLATLPGRRDIVWITNTMPAIANSFPCTGDWVECGLYVAHMAVTLDEHGVTVNPYYSSGVPQPTTSYDLEQMALLTGGHVYYLQDIREVLRQVARNATNTYEIAYAPSPESSDNKFHKIRIACERKGVKLQVKERYYALPDTRPGADRQKEALLASSQRPSDCAGIGLRVKASPVSKGIHVEIRVDAADLLLREHDGKFSDTLNLVLSDLGASEGSGAGLLRRPVSDPIVSDFNLDLSKEQYDTMMVEGVRIAFDHVLSDEVQQVRVIVMDRGTNEVGSVTFPAK